MRRFLRGLLWSLMFIVASAAGLFAYFVYTPDPERPRLSGAWSNSAIEVGRRRRLANAHRYRLRLRTFGRREGFCRRLSQWLRGVLERVQHRRRLRRQQA